MKTGHIILMAAIVLTACSPKQKQPAVQAEPAAQPTPAERLVKTLTRIQADGRFAYGHHDDTAYGYTWNNIDYAGPEPERQSDTTGRSDVREVCGDYPGFINWDLGMLEMQSERNLDGVPFTRIAAEVQKQDARGGLNSISWHPRNPATGGNSWDVKGDSVVRQCVTEGTELNQKMTQWITWAADYIGALRNADGERIPVVFRPWHEHTGSWFWWGKEYCSPQDYKALWQLTRRVFDERGIDNVVWCYSPDRIADEAEYTERYPGDDYVDILGADVYMFGAEEGVADYLERARRQLGAATSLAKTNGKLVALSETGSETLPMAAWYSDVLLPLCKEFPIAYVCVWRNASPWMKRDHFYAPYPSHPSEASFKAFYADSTTLFCNDIANYR